MPKNITMLMRQNLFHIIYFGFNYINLIVTNLIKKKLKDYCLNILISMKNT